LIGGKRAPGAHLLATLLPKTSKNVSWQKKSCQFCRFFPVMPEIMSVTE